MHDRHTNRARYFNEQSYTTEKYILPYLEKVMDISKDTSILEIGCGEGGNLKPFLERGCKKIIGIDLSESKINLAKQFYAEHKSKQNISFISQDVYDIDDLGVFDLILTKDVIEHIHDQHRFMERMKYFMKPTGKFFLGFPPWYNPFGGHQQMCKSRFLSKLPYFHLLPNPIYRFMLKAFGESDQKVENLLEIKETGINTERFERICNRAGYRVLNRTFFFINPNYEVKFKLKPREQSRLISAIPYFRNFFTTANYYILSKDN